MKIMKFDSVNLILNDERMRRLLDKINGIKLNMMDSTVNFKSELKIDDVESNLKYFPLCMRLAHRNLISNNRLSHYSRVSPHIFFVVVVVVVIL